MQHNGRPQSKGSSTIDRSAESRTQETKHERQPAQILYSDCQSQYGEILSWCTHVTCHRVHCSAAGMCSQYTRAGGLLSGLLTMLFVCCGHRPYSPQSCCDIHKICSLAEAAVRAAEAAVRAAGAALRSCLNCSSSSLFCRSSSMNSKKIAVLTLTR